MASKRKYIAPRLQRREWIARVCEGGLNRITTVRAAGVAPGTDI